MLDTCNSVKCICLCYLHLFLTEASEVGSSGPLDSRQNTAKEDTSVSPRKALSTLLGLSAVNSDVHQLTQPVHVELHWMSVLASSAYELSPKSMRIAVLH
jgi:hypothetical protein